MLCRGHKRLKVTCNLSADSSTDMDAVELDLVSTFQRVFYNHCMDIKERILL